MYLGPIDDMYFIGCIQRNNNAAAIIDYTSTGTMAYLDHSNYLFSLFVVVATIIIVV